MSKKSFAETVGSEVGFDPTIILTVLSFLIPLIQQWCAPKNKEQARGQIDDEFRRLRLVKLGRKKGDKCPARFRKAFKEGGVPNKSDQDKVWESMVENGFQDVSSVSAALAK